jgi:hypothetical protein
MCSEILNSLVKSLRAIGGTQQEGRPVFVLIQCKYTRVNDKPQTTSIKWYQSFADKLTKYYPGYRIAYMYNTNASIEKDTKETIQKYSDEMIVVDGSIASKYFAPIILPHFTFVGLTEAKATTTERNYNAIDSRTVDIKN